MTALKVIQFPEKTPDRLWRELKRARGAFEADPCPETENLFIAAHKRFKEAYLAE